MPADCLDMNIRGISLRGKASRESDRPAAVCHVYQQETNNSRHRRRKNERKFEKEFVHSLHLHNVDKLEQRILLEKKTFKIRLTK